MSDLSPELAAAPLRQAQALEVIAEAMRDLAESQMRIAAALEKITSRGAVPVAKVVLRRKRPLIERGV